VDAEYSETGTNWDVWQGARNADDVWKRYFETLAECAGSGLYDLLAHPDLVKVWGPARPMPERDLRFFYEPAIQAIADAGVAVELSTAGLRKPVGELYPARTFLEMVADAGNPVTLSSDAHTPDHLGYGYAEALELLSEVGITELTTFDRRTPRTIPIEEADAARVHRHGNTPPPAIDPETGRPG
jgi:histidinol-phosphatase (PHP family)